MWHENYRVLHLTTGIDAILDAIKIVKYAKFGKIWHELYKSYVRSKLIIRHFSFK
jgi:hypothetical protein